VAQSLLVDVDVIDVRREPTVVPGASRTHVVVLRERDGPRVLPIFIGEPEGRAMASSLTGLQTPRPMTYQMAASLVTALSGSVTEVRVVRLSENAFIAEVVLVGTSGTKVVDARPSDAINLALLTNATVRVSTDLLEQWAPVYEQVDIDSYPDDANAIGAELASLALPPSLERLTPDGMEVFALAREEAHSRSHAAVGTGHILLALLRRSAPGGPGSLGIPVSAAEGALDTEIRVAQPSAAPPLTPRSCQVLLRAERRAGSRPDPRATPDDILAALLDETGGLAARVVSDFAIDREAVRASLASP